MGLALLPGLQSGTHAQWNHLKPQETSQGGVLRTNIFKIIHQEFPHFSIQTALVQGKIAYTCEAWDDGMSPSSDFKMFDETWWCQKFVFLSHVAILWDLFALFPRGLAYELLVVLGIFLHPGLKAPWPWELWNDEIVLWWIFGMLLEAFQPVAPSGPVRADISFFVSCTCMESRKARAKAL